MMRLRVVLFCVCAAVGTVGVSFAPAEAQYFNKHKSSGNSDNGSMAAEGSKEKKSIFLKPKASKSTKVYQSKKPGALPSRDRASLYTRNNKADDESRKYIRVNPYKFSKQDKLKVAQMKQESSAGMAFLEDWKAQGKTKPETPEEIKQYAAAQRSVSESMMYGRKEKLMAHLEKKTQRISVKESVSGQRVAGAFTRGGYSGAAQQNNSGSNDGAQNASPKTYLFNRKKKAVDEDHESKPKRIFNSYR